MKGFSFKRWLKAQEYERNWWESAAKRITSKASGQLDWYGSRAGRLERHLAPYIDEERKKSARVLEIGSGPVGIVSFLKWGEKYAIDPLEEYYVNNPVLTKLRNPEVRYIKGQGESIPFDKETFLMVIIDNVIDHTVNPDKVLKEIYRVLENNGFLYLSVNIHTPWGAKLHRLLSGLSIDKGHPHTFTIMGIQSILKSNNFRIEKSLVEDYIEARKRALESKNLKSKIKGYTGITEFIYQTICVKG